MKLTVTERIALIGAIYTRINTIGISYEYDILFGNLQTLYAEYDASYYNNESLGEYECMVDFLKSNENSIRTELSKRGHCLDV